MNKSSGPIDVGGVLGDLISDAVVRFAKEHNLKYELWYHDEPVWFVKNMQSNRTLRVQVAAFRTDPELGMQLLFIPEAYSWDEANKLLGLMEEERVKANIIALPVKEIAYLPADDISKRLLKELGEAWHKAKGVAAEDPDIVVRVD